MRLFILLLAILAVPVHLVGKEVDSSASHVQILREQVRSEKGHRGYGYWAVNRNTFPVEVKMWLSQSRNAYNGLASESQFVYPQQTIYLGPVIQLEKRFPYSWKYEWEALPADSERVTSRTGQS